MHAGVSSCQVATECTNGETPVRLHCAKRSSAALRTALTFEAEMKHRKIEECEVDAGALRQLKEPGRASADDNGIAARVRRDAKNAFEQRSAALACGEHPMVSVPVVGRVVRLHKQWYALCTYCASLTKVQPHLHRYGSEICCMRCDPSMVAPVQSGAAPSTTAKAPGSGSRSEWCCRYCGVKPNGSTCASNGWKEIKAPLDVAGNNASLPPPLRRVYYCRQHFRGWVTQAHRVLQTRVILAHLAHNAKPLFGSESVTVRSATVPKARRTLSKRLSNSLTKVRRK